MAESRFPLLRGRISGIDSYESVHGRPPQAPALPQRDPAQHRAFLLNQLAAIAQAVHARPTGLRDASATREIIAIRPAASSTLMAEQLDDPRSAVQLIGTDPITGTVLLDAPSPQLDHLRAKLNAYADDARVKTREVQGATVQQRASERCVAPIQEIALAGLHDRAGVRLRSAAPGPERRCWFEVSCRGGRHGSQDDNDHSRSQMQRQCQALRIELSQHEFLGPEQLYLFLRANVAELEQLLQATDCVYEVDLAPPDIRDWRLLDDQPATELKGFALHPPPANAPSVVLLDTGVATTHPMLAQALHAPCSVVPGVESAEDSHGHGTKMAGIALFGDVGAAVEAGEAAAPHWIHSVRLLMHPNAGTATEENRALWPSLTEEAVLKAEASDSDTRKRVFALAVSRTMDVFVPTLWGHALDQLAYGRGQGRLLLVAAGNADEDQWLKLAQNHPAHQLSEKIHDPAYASNVLTIGAFTERTRLPPESAYQEARPVAPRPGGISPYTTTGPQGSAWPIKPDVVFEGGNLAISPGPLLDERVETLVGLTTGRHHHLRAPLSWLSMTSEATARAAHFAAVLWQEDQKLRPESIRGLLVHSASWTEEMKRQFPALSDRLAACGYGVPNLMLARACAVDRATILIEDEMPNAVFEEVPKKEPPKRPTSKTTQRCLRRKLKLYRLPIPEEAMTLEDPRVELRVTLSYLTEPNQFQRQVFHGLDLRWDMQGPQESEAQFLERVNRLRQAPGADGKRRRVTQTSGFRWEVGVQRRSRGTVQSDRWEGSLSALGGGKLIAVMPVMGWWERRRALRTSTMPFTLIITVQSPGIYAMIKPLVELSLPIALSI